MGKKILCNLIYIIASAQESTIVCDMDISSNTTISDASLVRNIYKQVQFSIGSLVFFCFLFLFFFSSGHKH